MMTKALEDMSLEELWQLFPIVLREHQTEWKDWYEEERFRLLSFIPEHQIVRLSHIGSTSVETIWAKPIAVSYTHLDVYKRQVLRDSELLLTIQKDYASINNI